MQQKTIEQLPRTFLKPMVRSMKLFPLERTHQCTVEQRVVVLVIQVMKIETLVERA